jgi:hypothetical protein
VIAQTKALAAHWSHHSWPFLQTPSGPAPPTRRSPHQGQSPVGGCALEQGAAPAYSGALCSLHHAQPAA